MGNSNSHQHQFFSQQWTHSYPRSRHISPQVKVLPERIPPLRLRTTDNGAILQNGGTLSSRKQCQVQEKRTYRPRSSSAHRPPNQDEINLDKTRYGSEPDLRFHLRESREQFGENAVRQRISRSRKKYKAPPAPQNGLSSGVESSSSDLNGWESNGKDCASGRKARLFKTRAESSKKYISETKKKDGKVTEISRSSENLENSSRPKNREDKSQSIAIVDKKRIDETEGKIIKRSASQEVVSNRRNLGSPEFQAELLEAAQRLRPLAGINRRNLEEGEKSNMSDDRSSRFHVKNDSEKSHSVENESNQKKKREGEENSVDARKEILSARDKSEKGQNRFQVEPKKDRPERDVPSKKFYFGMEWNGNETKMANDYSSGNNVDKTNAEHRMTAVEKSKNLMNLYKSVAEGSQDWEESMDKFAATFHKSQMVMPNGNTTSCSSSFVSDPDEDVDGGIALQLRPTLPKKQLEIPRFSPTAAWRLLSSIDLACPQAPSPGGSDDVPVLLEDGIHPPASQQVLRSIHDKSGDSGISGDASPGGCPESSSEIAVTSAKATPNPKNVLMAWTPQQDLEEESSSDDLECPVNSPKNVASNIPGAKFSPRGQLFLSRDHSFSMSLPREDMRMHAENVEEKERANVDATFRLNSLQMLKTALGTSKRHDADERTRFQNDNWVLSRSVPSSLNNSHAAIARSISNPSSPEQDDECSQQTSLKYPSYSYLANGGRMMYLPEYHSRMSPDVTRNKHNRGNMRCGFLSKSCENISRTETKQFSRSRSPSPIVGRRSDDAGSEGIGNRTNQKKKKFTFQSTVRLLENRRLAEKLSREAELKENQRLSELEAMKRVEEEFQKKRAREKASIRHQLRLFNMGENNYSSLPPVDWEDGRFNSDEAPSSLPTTSGQVRSQTSKKYSTDNRKISPCSDSNKFASSTQVLSEYRETIREYRDYRHSRYNEPQTLPPENNRRSVVEHPRAVYDMPKSTAVYISAPANSSVQNQYKEDGRGCGFSTPRSSRSDNYRKDFAHGALAAGGRSLNSSDSELSQTQARSSSSCRRITSRRLNALHRSRSESPDSMRSVTSPKAFDAFVTPPRSRSNSPIKIIITEKRTSRSLERKSDLRENDFTEPVNAGDIQMMTDYKSLITLERKLSNPGDYHGTFNSHKGATVDRNTEKTMPMTKTSDDVFLRFGMPSLQPFNKTEKSFRSINFNPVINKLAQTVN